MYFPTLMESGNLRERCCSLISPGASLLGLQMTNSLLCPHVAFSLCACIPGASFIVLISSSYKDTSQIGGEGNGNPLQCSCLENPRDGGAWWAAVYGVAQSQTRLKRLSSTSSSQIGLGPILIVLF